MEITYGSVRSGIEAATLTWKPLGMRTPFVMVEALYLRSVRHLF